MKKFRGRRSLWITSYQHNILCLGWCILATVDLAALDTMDFTYTVIGSAGITGKSSGEGKCVRPKVCHNTTSSLSRLAEGLAEIQAGRPWEGSPEVCGTWRPAGWSWESSSVD